MTAATYVLAEFVFNVIGWAVVYCKVFHAGEKKKLKKKAGGGY
jgi:hypothetical protein